MDRNSAYVITDQDILLDRPEDMHSFNRPEVLAWLRSYLSYRATHILLSIQPE